MPVPTAQLALDLQALLSRALSRSGTGAWDRALDALARAGEMMPVLVANSHGADPHLRRCAELLGDLRVQVIQAQDATRAELDQIRYARTRLKPTRSAYGAPASSARNTRFASSA